MQLGLKDVSGRAKTAKRQVHRLRNTKCSCISFTFSLFGSATCVHPSAKLQLLVRTMSDSKDGHVTEQFQRHAGDLSRMLDIGDRATADHHVCITHRLDLKYAG